MGRLSFHQADRILRELGYLGVVIWRDLFSYSKAGVLFSRAFSELLYTDQSNATLGGFRLEPVGMVLTTLADFHVIYVERCPSYIF